MIRLRLLFTVLFFVVSSLTVFSQDLPPEIVATGDQNYCSDLPMSIVTSVSITDPDVSDTTLDELTIQISEGYASGFDNLTLTGTHPNINTVWVPASGQLFLNGPATFSEFEAAILEVVFTTTQVDFTADRSFSINLGNANYLPSTDHYYFYVADFGISWSAARTAAENSDFFGLQGYLATITTQEEAQLAGEQAQGTGWIGASDAETESTWKWVTGPEAGTTFWQGAVSGTPVNDEFSFWNSGEPNNLGAIPENYAHITDPSIGLPGSWNDLPLGGDADVNSPFHPKGYIVEYGGLPGDPIINLSAATSITMPQFSVTNVQGCEGDNITLSVTANTDEVIWYDDAALTNQVNTGLTFTQTFSATTTYFVSSSFSGCSDADVRQLTVTINPNPEAIDITIQQCDDASSDGISVFELNTYNGAVSNGSISNIVTYFEDAALTNQLNALSYLNTTNNQIVYAKVLNETTDCFSVAEVILSVALPSDNFFLLEICDDEVEDGLSEFSLSDLNDEALTGLPVTAQTSFFSSFDDAVLNNNPLPNNYTNTSPYSESIFVKISDGTECLGINRVDLTVNPLPELLPDETVIYCLNTFPDKIILNGGIVNDVPNNFYYDWSTGETTIEIEVDEPGTYTVNVTEVDGCSNLRTIIVLPSNTATINSIDVIDAVENNTVTIDFSGEGDYEFSLDSENGPFQDSNTFENVPSGIQTIYIRDINGCGVIAEEFPVIGFPKFFTPNGDANNDFWTIDGFNQEFLASSRVQIFSRHGKLLTELSAENPFWDGRYNGNNMPADDYWFSVTFTDGRSFTKHFALVR